MNVARSRTTVTFLSKSSYGGHEVYRVMSTGGKVAKRAGLPDGFIAFAGFTLWPDGDAVGGGNEGNAALDTWPTLFKKVPRTTAGTGGVFLTDRGCKAVDEARARPYLEVEVDDVEAEYDYRFAVELGSPLKHDTLEGITRTCVKTGLVAILVGGRNEVVGHVYPDGNVRWY